MNATANSHRRFERRLEHRYYAAALAAAALVVFAGFSRSYFLRPLFTSRAMPLLLHLHGLVMTSWLVLFFVQALLIAVEDLLLIWMFLATPAWTRYNV